MSNPHVLPLMSEMLRNNLYTMGIASRFDKRQAVPDSPYITPPMDTCKLRAQLILEEALETIKALGFEIEVNPGESLVKPTTVKLVSDDFPNLMGIVDGCIDTKYVAVGTLAACGVCDIPHITEVLRANKDKFPEGKTVVDGTGKFTKPPGWVPPNHSQIMANTTYRVNLKEVSESLISVVKANR